MFGSKCDHDVSRFGFVRLQAIPIGVAPVGNVHHLGQLCIRARGLGRLHDVEPVAVEEERVLPKQAVQLRNHWMVVRNGLALELGQSSFDCAVAIVVVPSQSAQLVQPSFAYCVFGHVGMSEGRRPDLQYSRHAFAEFKSRLRAKARAPFFHSPRRRARVLHWSSKKPKPNVRMTSNRIVSMFMYGPPWPLD
jgi:hypothetical protein